MKSVIRWVVQNSPAMNVLMVSVMLVGAFSLYTMRREVFPEFELEIILVSVPYPGASPAEVEEGICQKIEEAVRSIDGIKKQTAIATEGVGTLVLELNSDVKDVQKVLNEVRSEIDRISTFPERAEDPEVKQLTMREPVIRVGVIGPDSDDPLAEWQLRELAERVRDELISLPSVSQAELQTAKNYQIDVEISEDTLREHGLTLEQVAELIRRQNLELPAGTIKTDSQDVLVKGKDKSLTGEGIAALPLLTQPGGTVLTVGELGLVRDEFDDTTAITRVNGKPAAVISVDRTAKEDLLAMTRVVNEYVAEKQLPAGYELLTWGDRSLEVRDRLELLKDNGLQGLVLVVIILAIFLDFRLAFWVSLGIPISMLGACLVLVMMGQTLNMLSSFAFLIALGIVVDDAIVIGENVYSHRLMGKGFVRAAIDGTAEVFPSVTASVLTTVIAFMPLLFVSGVMGKFVAVIPVAIIAMLLISLFESAFILPCHLAHDRNFTEGQKRGWMDRLSQRITSRSTSLLEKFIERCYLPILQWGLRKPATLMAVAASILFVAVGVVRSGRVPFVIFPKMDSNTIQASITYPDGTPSAVTLAATKRLEQAALQVNESHAQAGAPIVQLTRLTVGEIAVLGAPLPMTSGRGGHVGSVALELVESGERDITSEEIVALWRKQAGDFPGAESVSFGGVNMGPGGTPIEFKLLSRSEDISELEAAIEECKTQLAGYPGVFDVNDDSRPGKWEFQIQLKDRAKALGISLADLAETVRASYYGAEVMRLQRGRHEVKLMVRYPREDRRSLADFNQIRLRTKDGAELPLTELADVQVERGYSEINRIDQLRSITIAADVNEAQGNASRIVADLQAGFMPSLLEKHPGVKVRWEGQQEQTVESMQSLFVGTLAAMVAMFVLLTLEFRSYFQPLLIMTVIPFGLVGAVGGHLLMGLPLTLFSFFGLVALTGVVVNDSIVLIDFINHRVRDGVPVKEALIEAGRRRFRPVLLTSVTTIAGVLPLVLETSIQAQVLIPMAICLSFGMAMSTVLVLVLVPTTYLIYYRITGQAVPHDLEDDEDTPPSARESELALT